MISSEFGTNFSKICYIILKFDDRERMVAHGLQSLAKAYCNSHECVCSRKQYSDKERLGANQSAEIRTEAQHCVPLRMNPNIFQTRYLTCHQFTQLL